MSQFMRLFLPYGFDIHPDNTVTFFNRGYHTLGGYSCGQPAIHVVKYASTTAVKRLLALHVRPDDPPTRDADGCYRVHLFNDGCAPYWSDEYRKAYFEKLDVLCRFTTMPEGGHSTAFQLNGDLYYDPARASLRG